MMETQDKPVFIPPKKRISGKKSGGASNHVDHIMVIQGKEKSSGHSPSGDSLSSPDLDINGHDESGDGDGLKSSDSGVSDRMGPDLSPILENGHTSGTVESLVASQPEQASTTTDSLSQSEQSLDVDLIKEAVATKKKKKVNICTDREEEEERICGVVETTALRRGSETSDSVAMSSSTDGCLTMTGTIKRGKKAGQSVDVRLNISREELEVLEATIAAKKRAVTPGMSSFLCNLRKGPHITIWTALCLPFAVIISGIYSFYMGTITWYNVFTYYTEEKPVVCRILVSPFLILLYPFLIVIFTLGLGVYAGLAQISWFFDSWYKEITDLEKGFYGWLCAFLKHEDCCPYEVVVLTEIQGPIDSCRALRSSSEDSTA
ncbi:uncharacterized protein [Anabrus simplex]|uniref:uncharacterized protein n=1 Tax=Anabrus simplex TaxID=316456 RepID=UPI0035A2ABE3